MGMAKDVLRDAPVLVPTAPELSLQFKKMNDTPLSMMGRACKGEHHENRESL
jgi:hypothetical protein